MESFTSNTQCRVHPWNSLCCIVVCSLDDSAPKINKAILTAWSALIPKSIFFNDFICSKHPRFLETAFFFCQREQSHFPRLIVLKFFCQILPRITHILCAGQSALPWNPIATYLSHLALCQLYWHSLWRSALSQSVTKFAHLIGVLHDKGKVTMG